MGTWSDAWNRHLVWKWINENLGMKIPTRNVCDNHDAPFEFIYAAFMGLYKFIVALANRSGGKTMNFAILAILDSLANDNCESANLGAIQAQAQRCYRYIKNFIEFSEAVGQKLKGKTTIGRSTFINNSSVEVLTATLTGVNSPHPQKLKMDEVELIPWIILQEAFSMVQSKEGVEGITVLGSTRKFANGPMQKLVDGGGPKNMKLFEWCIWEVIEAIPKVPMSAKDLKQSFGDEIPADVPKRGEEYWWEDVIRYIFGDELPEHIDRANGYYKWGDVIEKFNSLDRDVWDTQWTCTRPDLKGLIYSRFTDEKNIENNFKLEKNVKSIFISEDFGNSKEHPDVILFIQVDPDKQSMVVFDELYMADLPTEDIINKAKEKMKEHGLEMKDIKGWIPDHHMLTQVIDRRNAGLPIIDWVKKDVLPDASLLYRVDNGITAVRKFIDDGRFKMTPNCVQLREEFMSYSRKKQVSTGVYLDEPEKKHDHGPDVVRYTVVTLFPFLAMGSFKDVAVDKVTNRHDDNDVKKPIGADVKTVSTGSIAGGLFNKTF